MGGNRIKDLEQIIEKIFLFLEIDDFENFKKYMDKFLSINIENLSKEEAQVVYNYLGKIEGRLKSKQNETVEKIKSMSEVKKFKSF